MGNDPYVTTSLFFKAGSCGTSLDTTTDPTKAIFKTDIGKPAVVVDGIVTEKTILETDIICEYPSIISDIDMDPGMQIVADAAQAEEKIQQETDTNEVSADLFDMESVAEGR